ncbi:hypothetical protein BJX62DRAFT_208941 [Aspergillus germanicus]
MDPASRSNTVRFALEDLSQITNDETEEYGAQLAPIVSQISMRLSPRTETAVSVLNIDVARLSGTVRFLKENSNLTKIILETVIKAGDPMTAFLSGSTDLPSSLLRALSTRFLVGKFEGRYGENPNRKINKFLKEEGLSGSAVTNALKTGRKPYELEKGVEIPGVWIPLAPVLSKLTHLLADEVSAMIKCLSGGDYPDLVDVARSSAILWVECLKLFTIYVGG